MEMTYGQRAEFQENPVGKRLFKTMESKRTNLCISADVTTKAELTEIARVLGPKMCVLKTHINIIGDFDNELIETLTQLAEEHDFLIFEDRKFADIGNTVRLQYEGGIYCISSWADMVNFHTISGPGILDGLRAADGKMNRGFIVISQMSSEGNLLTPEYSQNARELAQSNPEDVFAFICMNRQSEEPGFLHMTPGVNISVAADGLGQKFRTPEQAICQQGCDIIIVGRGIIHAENMEESAEQYRLAGWLAYEQRIERSKEPS